MEGDFIKIYDWLRPLSWLYGLGVGFRNQLFELGILRSRSFSVPVISVGNITVGGSGKTPHVEYLIRLLQDKAKVAVLSRGYKRKSRGYLLAEDDTPMRLIGDEPYQMKRKFPKIHVAVDKKRCEGIDRLTSDEATCDTDVVLLDDAYQHRYVKPGINILLVDYHRLILYDELLPAGRLREPKSGKDRADIVIITKCPPDLKPVDYRVLTKAMNLFPYQELYFSCLAYDELHRLFGEEKERSTASSTTMCCCSRALPRHDKWSWISRLMSRGARSTSPQGQWSLSNPPASSRRCPSPTTMRSRPRTFGESTRCSKVCLSPNSSSRRRRTLRDWSVSRG